MLRGFCLILLIVSSCPWLASPSHGASSASVKVSDQDQASHPLAGRIWAVEEARFITPETLLNRIAERSHALLGERHGHREHHRLQAWITGELARQKGPGHARILAYEMIPVSRQEEIDAHFRNDPTGIAGLGDALQWDRSGWPDWRRHYAPIAEAFAPAAPFILGANLAPESLRAILDGGFAALDSSLRAVLRLDDVPAEPLRSMALLMEAAHGHILGRDRAKAFAAAQFARDAQMANILLRQEPGHGFAVLIAGYGHVRKDHGVPWHMERQKEGSLSATFALAMIVVEEGNLMPGDYAGPIHAETLPFDAVWFTASDIQNPERDAPK